MTQLENWDMVINSWLHLGKLLFHIILISNDGIEKGRLNSIILEIKKKIDYCT